MHEMHYSQLVRKLVSRDVYVPAKFSEETGLVSESQDMNFPAKFSE